MTPALQEVVALLPVAAWGPVVLAVLGPSLSVAATFALARGLGKSLPQTNPEHWTELARRLHPINLALSFGLVAVLVSWFIWGALHPATLSLFRPAHLAGIAALSTGVSWFALLAALQAVHVSWEAALKTVRGHLALFLIFKSHLLILAALATFLPATGSQMVVGASIGMFLAIATSIGWGVHVARGFGWVRRGPAYLEQAAAPARVFVVEAPVANAFAFGALNVVLFTDRLLENVDREGVLAILEHERGHLAEGPGVILRRIAGLPYLMALAAWNPLVAHFGIVGFLAVAVGCTLPLRGARRFARTLEEHADHHVHQHTQVDSQAYARALETLNRLNLVPMVVPATPHPPLYDRLVALGHPPPYARPDPPQTTGLELVAPFAAALPVCILLSARLNFVSWWAPQLAPVQLAVGVDVPSFHLAEIARPSLAKDPERALVMLEAASDLDPRAPYPWALRAWTELNRGEISRAREALQRAQSLQFERSTSFFAPLRMEDLQRYIDSNTRLLMQDVEPRLEALEPTRQFRFIQPL